MRVSFFFYFNFIIIFYVLCFYLLALLDRASYNLAEHMLYLVEISNSSTPFSTSSFGSMALSPYTVTVHTKIGELALFFPVRSLLLFFVCVRCLVCWLTFLLVCCWRWQDSCTNNSVSIFICTATLLLSTFEMRKNDESSKSFKWQNTLIFDRWSGIWNHQISINLSS